MLQSVQNGIRKWQFRGTVKLKARPKIKTFQMELHTAKTAPPPMTLVTCGKV